MKAVYASTVNHADPLAALAVGEQPEPQARPFWSTVSVRAVTVNHHDVWSLQGVGLAAEQTPMILGTDAVGILDEDIPGKHGLKAGSEVVLYTFVGTDGAGVAPGERRTILSEKYPGTMAEKTSVPSANVFAKPASLTTAEAAALGTSWLTAYSLLFDAAGIKPGDSVLIQGAGGGVSTAAIQLAHAAGLEVFVTSRDADKRSKALKLGANAALEIGARLPRKVDAVIESVEKDGSDLLVTVRANVFTPFAYLMTSDDRVHYSDNYFKLYPGEAKTIRVENCDETPTLYTAATMHA